MQTSYFVLYRGRADNAEGFVRRYKEVHVPILRTWPGIQGIVLHQPANWSDPYEVKPAGLSLMAQMIFADGESLSEALRSPQRGAARDDFRLFPPFRGEVLHQATISTTML